MASARASRNVPNAAQNSFSAATRPSDHQNGSSSDGQVKGENSADWLLATNGRPAIMVRVPQRHVGQLGARVLRERLELQDGVGLLVVRADTLHAGGALRRPRRRRP